MLKVGDKVRRWKVFRKTLEKKVWTVTKIEEVGQMSGSGYIVDVEIPACTSCGAPARHIIGYDSDWFVKVEDVIA